MPNRDDFRGYRGDERHDQRRGEQRGRDDWGWSSRGRGDERRSFGEGSYGGGGQDDRGRYNSDQARYGARGGSGMGEQEPWRRDRYGSRFDQDRADYGSGYDREGRSYGRGVDQDTSRFGSDRSRQAQGRGYGGESYRAEDRSGGYGQGYGGQEYGVEAGGSRNRDERGEPGGRNQGRETWNPGGGEPYGDLELNARNRDIQEYGAPHDYAYHPQQGHEFDPDYVDWRDQQLAGHDRDYQEWRRHQHEQYDNDYRNFRSQRREKFGNSFTEWRSQRNMNIGAQDETVSPGMSGSAQKTAWPGNLASNADAPSGMIESNAGMSNSPVMTQTGGGASHSTGSQTGGASTQGSGDTGPEFGREPSPVQAASNGGTTRGRDEDKARENNPETGKDAKH